MMDRIAAAALIGALMTSAACAQTSPTNDAKSTQPAARVDGAERGAPVSRTQFLADAAERFDAMDTNKDGQLTIDERKAQRDRMRAERGGMGPGMMGPGMMDGPAGPGKPIAGMAPPPPPPPGVGPGPGGGRGGRGQMFARLDTNGDGKVARAEFDLPFDRLDANKDGFVDQAEMAAIPTPGAGGGLGGGGGGGGVGSGQRMMRLDRDGDGKLSRAEFGLPFDRLDANKDGVIDTAEAQRLQAGLGGRRGGGLRLRREEAENQPQ